MSDLRDLPDPILKLKRGYYYLHTNSNIIHSIVLPKGKSVVKYWYVSTVDGYKRMVTEARQLDNGMLC